MVLETCHHMRAEGMSWSTLFTLRAVVERSLNVNKAVFYAVNLSTQLWKEPMRRLEVFLRSICQHSKPTQCGVYKKNYAVTDRRSQSASAAVLFNVNMIAQC